MMTRRLEAVLAVLLTVTLVVAARAAEVRVDTDIPAGNIVVHAIDGDTVTLAPDIRDTSTWWFYYHFRVRDAAGRTLTFQWKDQSPMAALGPAVSTDGGANWRWLGKEHVKGKAFTFDFPADADDVRFCLAMPYTLTDLERFIDKHADHPAFESVVHARSKKDRPIYRFHLGNRADPIHRVLLTSRHHACEMMASYELEGVIDAILADDETGKWLREHVEFLIVPMMDVDGVVDGDQGKNRKPHDHNRDYAGEPLYPSVAANKAYVPEWADGKVRIVLDLHCPYVRGGAGPGSNEDVYFVGPPDERVWAHTKKLAADLEAVRRGPIPFDSAHNLPWGQAWNTAGANLQRSSTRWAGTIPGVEVASTIEFPYATAGGVAVTPATARAFGHDLAAALAKYLRERDASE